MKEQWVENTLWLKDSFEFECYRRLLLDFVKPVVRDLTSKNLFATFHFLFEGGLRFLLRIEPNVSTESGDIKSVVRKHLSNIQEFIIQKPEEELFTDYPGEIEDFGEEGWVITKKVFEMGSRMAMAKIDPAFKKGKKFEEGKLLHCFLNSLGYSIFGPIRDNKIVTNETLFHLDQFIGRMAIIRNKKSIDTDLEGDIDHLVLERVKLWKSRPFEVI